MKLVINEYVDYDSGQERVGINFRNRYFVFPINKIGNNYQVDSVTIQGTTYYGVNFIADQYNTSFPFGCFYNSQYGILKIHFMDKDWPVPEGGEPWELLKR